MPGWPRFFSQAGSERSCARFRARSIRTSSISCIGRSASSLNWSRRAISPNAFVPRAQASARFFSPTGFGTELTRGRETRRIDGRDYVLELPLHADFALISALDGDRWGNLTYRKTARNFGPVMAMAAKTTVAQVKNVVELGALDPETVITPGIFVQKVVPVTEDA